ncbi:hypothetical protein P1S61_16230 [Streptomyces sp. ME08-AFT2]|uniref:hypothetical protein n=1 Tax=Streptomyces sp. ME08-AFT2 TaxID=3028683 RepID=UPI0029B3384E|nr:hypothetical protein [Streptomyces sp. ME08-AFT2]MDX3310602.1 hypothetical protein [Streptomyces sp. ME08-AFT2]
MPERSPKQLKSTILNGVIFIASIVVGSEVSARMTNPGVGRDLALVASAGVCWAVLQVTVKILTKPRKNRVSSGGSGNMRDEEEK